MQDIVIMIADNLRIIGVDLPNIDIYFLAILIVFFIFFCIIWVTKIYEIMFWLVLWISIYIVLQFLLLNPNPSLTVPKIISKEISIFLVWTTIYLIFILSILIPINWSFHNIEPKNKTLNIFMRIILSIGLVIFYLTIIAWFIEKVYIYDIVFNWEHMKNAFELIKWYPFWIEFSSTSKLYFYIKEYIPATTLVWILLVIYKLIFSDIVNLIISPIIDSLNKMIKNAWKGWWNKSDWDWWSEHSEKHDSWHWHH